MLWTAEESAFLMSNRPNMVLQELRNALESKFHTGRTERAVKKRCEAMGVRASPELRMAISIKGGKAIQGRSYKIDVPSATWSTTEDDIIRRGKERGAKAKKIQTVLQRQGYDRSRAEVTARVSALGLTRTILRARAHADPPSKYASMAKWDGSTDQDNWTNNKRKGMIAEAATMFRLALVGVNIYRSMFEGDTADMVAEKDGRTCRIQVKWVTVNKKTQAPCVSMARGWKQRKSYLTDGSVDVIGYHLGADSAFVFTVADIEQDRGSMPCDTMSLERFDKVLTFLSRPLAQSVRAHRS